MGLSESERFLQENLKPATGRPCVLALGDSGTVPAITCDCFRVAELLMRRRYFDLCVTVERSSSVVECRTRNRESPGSNPLCYRLPVRSLGIFVHFTAPQSTQLYKRVPSYRQWWKCA